MTSNASLKSSFLSGGWQLPLPSQLVCLLLAFSLLAEPVFARPMYGRHRTRRGPKPKWVNPCGIDPALVKKHALANHMTVTPLTNQEIITSILLSAKNALVHADDFKEKFVSRKLLLKCWRYGCKC